MSKTIITGGKMFIAHSNTEEGCHAGSLLSDQETIILFLESYESNVVPPYSGYSLSFVGSLQELQTVFLRDVISDTKDGLVALKQQNTLGGGGWPLFLKKIYKEAMQATSAELCAIGLKAYSWNEIYTDHFDASSAIIISRYNTREYCYRLLSNADVDLMVAQSIAIKKAISGPVDSRSIRAGTPCKIPLNLVEGADQS